jgi:hypothetical protein
MTDNNKKLAETFATNISFKSQIARFEKNINSIFHQTFPKIREKKRKFKEDEVGYLIEQRKKLKLNQSSPENDKMVENIEDMIIDKTEQKYAKEIFEAIGHITGEDGELNNNGVWKQIQIINPNKKKRQQIPTAMKDKKGNLITNQEALKKLALDDIKERLRKRPIHPELKKLEIQKKRLAKMRLKIAQKKKTPPWSLLQMEEAIQSMKNKKCRDAKN